MDQNNGLKVECPRCGNRFALSETFRAHFEAEKQTEIAAALQDREAKFAETVQQRETALRAELSQDHQARQAEQAQQLAALTEQLQAQQVEQAEREAAIRTETEAATQEQLAAFQQREEELRQQMQQEQAERAQQEALIREQVKEEALQEFALQREQDALERQRLENAAAEAQAKVTDMQRKLQQGPVELQGEALEAHLKRRLQERFPFDQIEDVERGQLGADLTQAVYDSRLGTCGVIVWEAKRTKHWNDDWLEKIKSDAERVGAQMRVIVSEALPKDIQIFALRQGVWVSSVAGAIPLAETLRSELVAIAGLQRAEQGKGQKMEAVYRYLASPRFGERIQRMAETWGALEAQVASEERAMRRQWNERRKQLAKMQETTIDMFTDISSIMRQEIAQVPALELEALPPGEDADAVDADVLQAVE